MFHSIAATVVFVKDMTTCKTFYRDTLGLQVTDHDPEHVSVQMENVYFLLLEVEAAAHMISEQELELKVEGGPRGLLAAGVEDVDAAYEALKAKGVTFLRPPADQPWGLRTAYFADPEGNLWEINQPIASMGDKVARIRSRSKLARLYMLFLMSFSRFICSSKGLLTSMEGLCARLGISHTPAANQGKTSS